MSRTAKIWLIIAGICVILGPALIIGATAAAGGGNLFNAQKYETVTHEIGSTFDQIAVDTDITDVTIATANEKQCRVECSEPEKMKHTAEVENGTLVIRSSDSRQWYEHLFSFASHSPKVVIYLPQSAYASLQIDTHTGDVTIPSGFTFDTLTVNNNTGDVECSASVTKTLTVKEDTGDISLSCPNAGELDITASTGDIDVTSAKVKGTVSVKSSTGDITLTDTVAEKKFQIESSTGDVGFKGCDAADIKVKTSTGDVTGTLLSDKIFVTDTSTGDVKVPQTSSGGRCEISTSTGDILIQIK
ncbi:DUF4097 family beta strand repeat-containing protein [Ruminococcus sp.]|uniref:DUF4097 family beta strand repeat-containing protein n=1 Tax=Ruminococcus sp. TaxID=41978 RepID=UPI00292F1D48|nr:DUF4097 family beta strand repeat-containing protein [uncultured Ruminococcus sp.]